MAPLHSLAVRGVGRVVRTALSLVAALAVALGAGGIVEGADHRPGDATRPELTARADAEMAARLDALAEGLRALEGDVTRLGEAGRSALASLAARRVARLTATLTTGDALLARIEERHARLRADRASLPYAPSSDRISAATRARVEAVDRALATVGPLRRSWALLAGGTLPAVSLTTLLEQHDRSTFQATQLGTRTEYARAVAQLRSSLDMLARARRIRDALAKNADVSVLTQWLDRNRAYDTALHALYSELTRSGGRVTPRARTAFRDVQRAGRLLPPDTRALVVIMSDIAQGGLNQAVIAIEQARGSLAAATAAVH